jgi:hypothetical protein
VKLALDQGLGAQARDLLVLGGLDHLEESATGPSSARLNRSANPSSLGGSGVI